MKTKIRQSITLGLMLITALSSLISTSVFAASNSAFLTPASGTTQSGNTFTVSVDGTVSHSYFWWITVGANTAQGSLNFPAQQLKVTSISMTGSSFPNGTPTFDNAAGTISFNMSSSSGSYYDQAVHLFSVTFQAVAPGNAAVLFGSTQYNIGNAATTGGAYTLTAPPAPPPSPSPSPTPKPSTKPVVKATPTPTPKPTITPTVEATPAPIVDSDGGLKIENVKVTATRTENSIAWSLNNAAAKPTVSYGTSKNSLLDAGDIPQLPDGSYKLTLDNLNLGTLYYFTIKASTDDKLSGATYSGVLTTRGYPVQLTIEQNNLTIPGAKVSIGERQFVASKDGVITAELSDGDFTATITIPDDTTTHTAKFTVKKLTVPDDGNPSTQTFTLNVATAIASAGPTSTSPLPLIIGVILAALAIAGGIAGFLFLKRRKPTSDQPSVDVDKGQLTQTYGSDVGQYMSNTPEPNLGGGFVPQPQPTQDAGAAYDPANTTDPEAQAPVVAADSPAIDLSEQPVQDQAAYAPQEIEQTQQLDTTAPPLPPINQAPPQDLSEQPVSQPETPQDVQAMESYADQPVAQVEPDNNESLSEEITKVESSEQIPDNNEPSAVYDSATGELDIIHHHAAETAIEAADTTTGLGSPTSQGVT
jgi:hypothetical protein